MLNAKQLPSGSWRVRVWETVNGKQTARSFTAPTKDEAEYMAAAYRRQPKKTRQDMTVSDAVDRYIELSEILAPASVSTYKKRRKTMFPDLMKMKVRDLDNKIVQDEINKEAKRQSQQTGKPIAPKTVHSEWGLISPALKTVCDVSFYVRLPRIPKKLKKLPDPAVVLGIMKGSNVELPGMLAMWCSLRMAEVRGLMCSSVDGNYINIDHSLVEVDGENIFQDLCKTDGSTRQVYLPAKLRELISQSKNYQRYLETGEDLPIVPLTRNQIYHRFVRLMEKNGIDMPFHDLRHMYASMTLNLMNIPKRAVMDAGGWKTPEVMERYYSNMFDEVRLAADTALETYLDSITKE